MRDDRREHQSRSSPVPAGASLTVGRERELVLVSLAIENAVRGTTHTLILAGEAGIGKSRMLADAMRLMRDAGGLVTLGRCLDERGLSPFFPWIDALTDLDEQVRRRSEAGGDPALIGSLTPILLEMDAGLPTMFVGAEQRSFRQIFALTRALGKAASAVPILIAFDDLQWADPASNQLLRSVATALAEAPVVFLGAYRTEDAEPNRELLRTLEELNRQRLVTTIHLAPITEDATHQLVNELLGRPAPALGGAIHRQAAGNPFAIEEIVRAIATDERLDTYVQDSAWLPEPAGVQALIRRRVDRLDPAVREPLEIAALTGRDFSIDLVRRASDLTPDTLARQFDAAVRAELIDAVPDQPDLAYRFRHDRVRETIVAGIGPVRRQALHARLAEAVRESRQLRDRLERPALLLHHLLLAGAREEAAGAAEQLGSEAMQAHAFDQAAEAFDTALTMRRAAGAVPQREEARLLLLRGDALLAASHPDTIAVLAEAERCAHAADDMATAGRARLRRGRAHARRGEHQLAADALRSAREAFSGAGRHDREALLTDLELIALLGTSLGAYREAIETGERALASVAARANDPALEAAVRLELAKSLMRAGQLAAGHDQLSPALGLALGADALDLAAEISAEQANYAYWTGRLDLSERAARHRREYATLAGDPFAMRNARSWLANIAIARGDWVVARGLIAEATADTERIDHPEPAAFLRQLSGVIALSLGQLDEAVMCIEQAVAGFRQAGPAALPGSIGMLAHAHHAAGNAAAASEAVREAERLIAASPAGALPLAPALAQLGAVAVLRHDQAAADRIYRALLPYQGQFHWVLIDRVLGMLARTFGDQAAAGRHLATAAAAALREGMRPEHALSMAGLAFDAARASDSERTRAELDQAVARLRALGMEGAIRRLEWLTGSGRTEAPAGRPAGLTERELAVLRLVAQGMSNRDISERLQISEKTVVNHLTHIYRKAGIENRAGAVMFAVRIGLIPG